MSLYDEDGQLWNATGKTADLNLTPEAYKHFLSGVTAHLEISIPERGGPHFLRIGVRDIPANRFGAVELAAASVASLTPADVNPASTSVRANTEGNAKLSAALALLLLWSAKLVCISESDRN